MLLNILDVYLHFCGDLKNAAVDEPTQGFAGVGTLL